MDYKTASNLASLISRPFAKGFFAILVSYDSVSASEAASFLDLHIKTAQDFLDGMVEEGMVSKEEVSEGKRPYYRYRLEKRVLDIRIDLSKLKPSYSRELIEYPIRERKNSNAIFTEGAGPGSVSSIRLFTGEGRRRKERKINLTSRQGRFLFHLPFPNAEPKAVRELMGQAGLGRKDLDEILDIVKLLLDHKVIEKISNQRDS